MSIAEEPPEAKPDPAAAHSPIPPRPSVFVRARRWLTERRPEFKVGTLHYTGFGMIMVFVWLLWGDFCFILLDTHIPELLPLKLKEMGASDTANSVLNKTLAYTITFFLAPWVSFRSDRTRTRWGRRIPYLLLSTPFVGLFLCAIGYYDSLTTLFTGGAEQVRFLGMTITKQTAAILVIGALMVGWDFANIFVSTVYYYLFNDVVPSKYLSRFLALFRIVFSLASIAYHRYVFPHGLTHFKTIFIIAGIAYVVGFTLMCLFVREGSYPPPPPNIDRRKGIVSSIRTYASECFTHKLYWFFFLATACTYTSRLGTTFINVRYTSSLNMSLTDVGVFNQWVTFIALFLHFPSGWLSDRFHPLRVYIVASSLFMLASVAHCYWIIRDFGASGNLMFLYITGLAFMPFKLIAEAAELPMYMRLLPKDRYGQFCSANGMVRAAALIVGSVVVGMFIGGMAPWFGERRYTWIAAWQLLFQLAALVFLLLLLREWKRHGGDTSYRPPVTDCPAPADVCAAK